VTNLRAENDILRNLVFLMTVAQGQPLSLPIISTQAETVASTTPISTVFASTPRHAMLEGYLWSTPLSSGEVFHPAVSKVQALGQQFTPFFQTGHPTPQATVTYTAPLVHTTPQEEGQIYHSSVAGKDRVSNLEKRHDARVGAVQKELKTMCGKKVFGQNVHDLCLVPNVVIPPKFKVPDF